MIRSLILIFALLISAPFTAYASERPQACTVAFQEAQEQCLAQPTRVEIGSCILRATEESKQCIADDPDPPRIIAINSPKNGATVSTRTVSITGYIANPGPSYLLTVSGFPGNIQADGTFSINYPLSSGLHTLIVSLYDSAQKKTIDNVALDINYLPASQANAAITTASGGVVEVTDPNSPIFGAKFSIGPNGVQRDFLASLDYDPEHLPNLPFRYVQAGEPVVLYPLGETLNVAGSLTIPFDKSLLPNGATASDIFVLALADKGWVELPAGSLGASTVTVTIDGLVYGPFVAAIRKPAQ